MRRLLRAAVVMAFTLPFLASAALVASADEGSRGNATASPHIRSLAPTHSVVHIVTHSMGGVVADRAFAQGLSHEDGVATYVAWSAPHSGSDAARGFVLANSVARGPNPAIHESLLWLRMESESQAV